MFDGESGRQFGNCSEAYANYAIERLEVCVLTVSHLRDHFKTQGISQTVSHRSREVLSHYKSELDVVLTGIIIENGRNIWMCSK